MLELRRGENLKQDAARVSTTLGEHQRSRYAWPTRHSEHRADPRRQPRLGRARLLRRRHPARRADAAHRRARRGGLAAAQLQRRERLQSDALGADDRAPSDPHRRGAVGACRPAARPPSVGDHARAAPVRRRLRDRHATASGISATGAGRFPTDRGFDEWYGIPRTSNESMFTTSAGYDPDAAPLPVRHGSAQRRGAARNVELYDLEMRRRIDAEIVDAHDRLHAAAGESGEAASSSTCRSRSSTTRRCRTATSKARTGAGDFADAMIEMDHRVGRDPRCDRRAAACATTRSSSSRATTAPSSAARGAAPRDRGRGTYHTSMEGGLRVPFIVRWPGHVPAGTRQQRDRACHRPLHDARARRRAPQVPTDRPIDGVDQLDFLLGRQEHSNREGFLFYIKTELRAVKWRNWKMHLVWEPEPNAGAEPSRVAVTSSTSSRTRRKRPTSACATTGCATPMRRMIHAFQESLKRHPPIPPGAPDDYTPDVSDRACDCHRLRGQAGRWPQLASAFITR